MGYDDDSQPLTTSFADYLLPTAPAFPTFETQYQQTPSPLNPLGAKGAGEVGTIPAAAAVISAIEDALRPHRVRITRCPMTPALLRELIEQAWDRGRPARS
jgi:carbon-monoxide dehydrogenase large subunit